VKQVAIGSMVVLWAVAAAAHGAPEVRLEGSRADRAVAAVVHERASDSASGPETASGESGAPAKEDPAATAPVVAQADPLEPFPAQQQAADAGEAPAAAAAASTDAPEPPASPAAAAPPAPPEPPSARLLGRTFGFAWQSQTEAQGTAQLAVWFTERFARVADYTRTELRAAYSKALTARLQTWLFLDAALVAQGLRTPEQLDPRLSTLWQLQLRPSLGGLGLAAQAGASASLDGLELELRAIADTRLDGFSAAANFSVQQFLAWRSSAVTRTRLEGNLAVGYTLFNLVSAGLEVRSRTAFTAQGYDGTGFYVGPTFGVRRGGLWFNFSALAQVAAVKAAADLGGEPLEMRDNERFQLRLMFGGAVP
jgi:hypothetical protein